MSKDMRDRIAALEGRAAIATVLARRFWRVLATRVDTAAQALFVDDLDEDARRVVDVAFDAAQTVWSTHRVLVEPCRRVLDAPDIFKGYYWPSQYEMFTAHYPGGESKNVTRAQLLMMAGMDPDA